MRDESFVSRGAFLEALLRRMEKLDPRIPREKTCLEFPEAATRLGWSEAKLRRLVTLRMVHATRATKYFPAMVTLAEIQRLSTTPGRRSRKS